jgi:hypothetical protein
MSNPLPSSIPTEPEHDAGTEYWQCPACRWFTLAPAAPAAPILCGRCYTPLLLFCDAPACLCGRPPHTPGDRGRVYAPVARPPHPALSR